ncbi:MAG: phosphoribosylamine--glycine ligase [Actinomycetota bacterium]|nr:phosphoribosylamine--glycine ligase [Actinomycetota bacterium]
MRVLVVGSAAREHALLWKLAQSTVITELFVTPGNGGMTALAKRLTPAEPRPGVEEIADLAYHNEIDLTIVGPENFIVDGIVDVFQRRGMRIFGPTKSVAQIEGSKLWAKQLMERVDIPTAPWQVFTDTDSAIGYARSMQWACVVKSDGLASGKGSFVCDSEAEVRDALDTLITKQRFGDVPVLIEERLYGHELSVFGIADGRHVVPFGAAQDHKRERDGDHGLNTGGMGAYSPVNHMKVARVFAERFFAPIVEQLADDGEPYVGFLYAGAILTEDGPRILEFNCRLGDPEAEVILPRLNSDLGAIINAAVDRRLTELPPLEWSTQEALCVVMASQDYPAEGDFGTPISGLDEAQASAPDDQLLIFHGGTDRDPTSGELVTNGGRIFAVTGLGATLDEAQAVAYQAVESIRFEGRKFRSDIGREALGTSWERLYWETSVQGALGEIDDLAVAIGHWRMPVDGNVTIAPTDLRRITELVAHVRQRLHESVTGPADPRSAEVATKVAAVAGQSNIAVETISPSLKEQLRAIVFDGTLRREIEASIDDPDLAID